jgi:hypothetical protein
MRVQEHIKISAAAGLIVLPWLKKDVWIPFAASIFIDVDHYLWHAIAHRTLSLRAALRYFAQANPPQRWQARLLHQPFVLGTLLFLAIRLRSRFLALLLAGLLFHVSLDVIHMRQTRYLLRTLSEQANYRCQDCGEPFEKLELHTVHVTPNLFDRYNPRHFAMLCPTCHERAHQVINSRRLKSPVI